MGMRSLLLSLYLSLNLTLVIPISLNSSQAPRDLNDYLPVHQFEFKSFYSQRLLFS